MKTHARGPDGFESWVSWHAPFRAETRIFFSILIPIGLRGWQFKKSKIKAFCWEIGKIISLFAVHCFGFMEQLIYSIVTLFLWHCPLKEQTMSMREGNVWRRRQLFKKSMSMQEVREGGVFERKLKQFPRTLPLLSRISRKPVLANKYYVKRFNAQISTTY